MAYTTDDLRELMNDMKPIKDKLASGDTSLTTDEASTLNRGFSAWSDYLNES